MYATHIECNALLLAPVDEVAENGTALKNSLGSTALEALRICSGRVYFAILLLRFLLLQLVSPGSELHSLVFRSACLLSIQKDVIGVPWLTGTILESYMLSPQ